MQIERLTSRARPSLLIEISPNVHDTWLAEHSERVLRLTQLIATLPEVGGGVADLAGLAAAALFHDAGWIVELRQGKWERSQVLTRPTSDIQRELGAALLVEQVGHLLTPQSARVAVEAIRQCNRKDTRLAEARILAEAEALDEVGLLYILRQFRHYQSEGRPIQQLVDSWRRQLEYKYWDLRLSEGFRFETTRELARRRLADVSAFIEALARDLHADDVRLATPSPTSPLPAG